MAAHTIILNPNKVRREELQSLQTELGLPDLKSLLNASLAVMEWVVKERKAGRIIASVDEKDKKYKEVNIDGLLKFSPPQLG